MAWALAALFFYALLFTSPLLDAALYGRMRVGNMTTMVATLDGLGFWILASIVFLTTVFMPLLKVAGTFLFLLAAHFTHPSHRMKNLYALLQKLESWTMVEIFALGFLISYARLQNILHIQVAAAAIGLMGLMISITAMDAALAPEAIWGKIKKRASFDTASARPKFLIGCDTCFEMNRAQTARQCSRCGNVLRYRKPNSLSRTWALLVAAALLYVPSNLLPVMNVTQFGNKENYTIFAGIRELAADGLWPLALIVLIASIVIPLFKIAAMVFLLIETRRQSAERLRQRTRLYRFLEYVGRWSMIDVFVVSVLVAVVRFGWMASIMPDRGIVCFAGVVILTILAVKSFDPRLMWDAAEVRYGAPQPGWRAHAGSF